VHVVGRHAGARRRRTAGRAAVRGSPGKRKRAVGYLRVDTSRPSISRGAIWRSIATGFRSSPKAEAGQVLEPEQFYIFSTRERLRIPPDVCAELVAFDATKGELRTHYAGFIDSGFGWSASDRAQGARLVLEIRTHDVPFLLEHGQPLFRIEFMRNEAEPDILYGGAGSSYQMQGLRLAKQFRM
jgi:deoxycytidine triphosphate deaminase